jgi:glycosyltransferase involved in cell wall biosynthesis
MRILYFHQYFNTPAMSGSTRSYEMARRWVAAGHQVEMITSWREATDRRDWFVTDEAGIRVHWFPVRYSNSFGHAQRIRAFLSYAVASARRGASLPADVVLASSTPLTIALPAVYTKWRRGVPLVFEVRDLWPAVPIAMGALQSPITRWLALRLEKFAYANSKAIVALSPGMAAGILATGVSADKISVIPNGSDLDLRADGGGDARGLIRAQLGVRDDDILVLYPGTLGQVNDVCYLVELAAALDPMTRIKFLTVGDGRERDKVRTLAAEKGVLGRNFFMLDRVPKNEMSGWLCAGDIIVSTVRPIAELEANCANKIFDGFAAGRCVAINHGGWLEDLLRESRAGVRFSGAAEQAARELSDLATKPAWIKEAGERGRALAESTFSRDALAGQMERLMLGAVREGEQVETTDSSTRRGVT